VRTALALTDIQAMKVQSEAWIELLEDSFALARAAVLGSVRTVAELEERLWARSPLPRFPSAPRAPGTELDLVERLAALREVPLLRGAGVQILSDLATACEVASFARDATLFERGHPCHRVFLIVEGEVEGRREGPDVTWRGGPGEIVCGTAAFGDPIVAWEAHATVPSRALTFRIDDWLDILEERFEMVRSTLGALSLDREQLLEDLATGS
jgi:hypothetical protein